MTDISALEGVELDAAVARALGYPLSCDWNQGEYILIGTGEGDLQRFDPSTEWDDGGPIIEREWPAIVEKLREWMGDRWAETGDMEHGTEVLRWFMRAYVASKEPK